MRSKVTIDDVRLFTLEQFERLQQNPDAKKLVHFHTINKYLLMAYGQNDMRVLGKLVANQDKKPLDIILKEYEKQLKKTVKKEITRSSTTNVLNKIYSHFKKKFTPAEKRQFLKTIDDYRQDKIPLGKILNYVETYVHKYENGYLQRQTFYLLFSDVEDRVY